METVIIDTGPLVAYLCREDGDHPWVQEHFRGFRSPLLTGDAVLSEAAFLLDHDFTLYRRNRRQAIPLIFPPD